MGEFIEQYGGWFVGLLTILGTWAYNSRKVQVDESALVLSKWKEFAEIHQADMKRLKEDMQSDRTRYEGELESLRKRIKEVEAEFAAFRKETVAQTKLREQQIKDRDEEIAGLKRQIAQNSQSTVYHIGKAQQRIDTLTSDKGEAHDEINERIDKDGADIADLNARMDQAGHNSDGKGADDA